MRNAQDLDDFVDLFLSLLLGCLGRHAKLCCVAESFFDSEVGIQKIVYT
jgi:hypothetical protein